MPEPVELTLPIYGADAQLEVEEGIRNVHFACDLSVCKGACCTMPGGLGAPILEHEIAELDRVLPIVEKYLPERALEVIKEKGVWQRERDGTLTIPAIDHRDCIFVTYDGDVAHCAIEKAFRAGEISGFPKPISCHLFPIRIYPQKRANEFFVCYEEIDECKGGQARGKQEAIPLIEFLESPLARAIGPERLESLKKLLNN